MFPPTLCVCVFVCISGIGQDWGFLVQRNFRGVPPIK